MGLIEAWQIEHRPWLYFFLRRLELTRWSMRGKVLHPDARWYARLLLLWLALTGYETERCCFCGWKVGIVWWCDDQVLWETVTGWQNGEGISCIQCFNDRADRMNLPLRWTIGPLCGYTNDEWLRIVAANEQRVREGHQQL